MPVVVRFSAHSAIADDVGRELIGEIARTIAERADVRRVRVEGHADICGSERDPRLPSERALAVAEALAAAGVELRILEVAGHGHPRLRDVCSGEGSPADRRVELMLLVCR